MEKPHPSDVQSPEVTPEAQRTVISKIIYQKIAFMSIYINSLGRYLY